MPALTNSSVGSSSSSDADGTGGVPALGEEAQEAAADLGGVHQGGPSRGSARASGAGRRAREPAVPTRSGVAAGPAARRRAALPAASPTVRTVRDAVAAALLAVVATRLTLPTMPALARPARRPRSPRRAAYVPGGGAAAEPDQCGARSQLLSSGTASAAGASDPTCGAADGSGAFVAAERRRGAGRGRRRTAPRRRGGSARSSAGRRSWSGAYCCAATPPGSVVRVAVADAVAEVAGAARSGRRAGAAAPGRSGRARTSASPRRSPVMTALDFGASASAIVACARVRRPSGRPMSCTACGRGHRGLQRASGRPARRPRWRGSPAGGR